MCVPTVTKRPSLKDEGTSTFNIATSINVKHNNPTRREIKPRSRSRKVNTIT